MSIFYYTWDVFFSGLLVWVYCWFFLLLVQTQFFVLVNCFIYTVYTHIIYIHIYIYTYKYKYIYTHIYIQIYIYTYVHSIVMDCCHTHHSAAFLLFHWNTFHSQINSSLSCVFHLLWIKKQLFGNDVLRQKKSVDRISSSRAFHYSLIFTMWLITTTTKVS